MISMDKLEFGILTHLSRSGSTLLSRMLDEYGDICVTTESELPLELFGVKSYAPMTFQNAREVEDYLAHTLQTTRIASWKLSTESILEHCESSSYPLSGPDLVRILLTTYRDTHKPEAGLVIYKACPFMPWHIQESLKHFEDVTFLHLLRDPRAVYHSQKHSIDPFTGQAYSSSCLRTAMDWKKAAEVEDLGTRLLEIRFEDLTGEPEATMAKILDHLGCSTASRSRGTSSFVERLEKRDQELHKDIADKPDPEKNMSWKVNLTPAEVSLIDSFLKNEMALKGYHPDQRSDSPVMKLKITHGLLHEKVNTLLRRSTRAFRQLVSNPGHLLRRIRLKLSHD